MLLGRPWGGAGSGPRKGSPPAVPHAVVSVQTYGRKKTAVAVALCKTGNGLMRINGCPLDLIKPEVLKMKVASLARPLY